MENAIKDRFTFTYESGINGSFLVVSTSKDENIIEFQVNMLKKNPNNHILPLDIRRNNDRINIYYNVTSKLSLSQYIKLRQVGKTELIDIFSGIVRTLLGSKGYLLSDSSFLLDEDYIFINPDTRCVSLVYLPVKLKNDIVKSLKDFAVNFVVYSANINEEKGESFLPQFISFLKKDTFSIIDFDKFLKEMKRLAAKEESDLKEPSEVKIKETSSENKNIRQNKEEFFKQSRPKVEIPKPKTVDPKKNEADSKGKSIINDLSIKPNIVIGALIQTAIVAVNLFLIFSGKLDSLGSDKISTVFGLLLISVAISYFIWKNVLKINFISEKNLKNSSVNDSKTENKPKVNIPSVKSLEKPQRIRNNQKVQKVPNARKIDSEETLKPHNARNLASEETLKPHSARRIVSEETLKPPVIIGNVNETVLLKSSEMKRPRLQILKDSGIEEIVINKPSFIIGRLVGQVDYVHSNNAIGKVHAEIITREGRYYLKDLNSKNGTYINGKRMDSNKEYEIKNNDRLTLANSEFVFIVD